MANLSNSSIKAFVKKHAKAEITDDGASAIAKILEKEAKKISEFAVKNAKKSKRNLITRKDITEYVLKFDTD